MRLWAKKYHHSIRNVAMVCVAAVALGSSTYAWFVSNNTVKGTTTNISAQSNAPFRKIDSVTVTESSGTTKELTGEEKAKADKLANSRFAVGDAETAITGNYAIKQTFYVGTSDNKAGSFKRNENATHSFQEYY